MTTLSEEENRLFYRLYPSLMLYANNQLQLNTHFTNANQWTTIAPEERWNIREAFYDHTALIDAFVQENPSAISTEELDIVLGWKHFVRDTFLLLRHLKKYTIFLTLQEKAKAYGVVALVDSFESMYPYPPIYLKTVLLPFKEKIIYDGLINFHRITFGGNMRRGFNEDYKKAKMRYGVIDRAEQLMMG